MFKKMPVCRLMISCPSDVKTEIEIINRVVDNINDSIGFSMNILLRHCIGQRMLCQKQESIHKALLINRF